MVIILATVLALACASVLLTGFTSLRVSNLNKVFLVYSFLLLLFTLIIQILFKTFLPHVQTAEAILILCCVMHFSNHFIISLDMVSLFNRLILFLYNNLKITEPYTAN